MAERKTTTARTRATPAKAAKPAAGRAAPKAAAKGPGRPATKTRSAKAPAAKPKAAAKPRTAKPAAKTKPRVAAPAAQRRSKRTAAARSGGEAARDVALFDNLAALRSIFAEHLVLTVERLQDALDDAVRHGRILPTDAQDLGQRIAQLGRKQLDDILAEVERLRPPRR
jgi:hypothetical protein